MVDPKSKKRPEPRRALGRGLDALLPGATASASARVNSEFQRIGIERIRPQKGQPRKRFDDTSLAELAASIEQQGLIQPIVVRRSGTDFEIVAGERRWRAAQRAGLHEIPVVIKDVAPAAAFELALVENLQRMDLDPIETAQAYQRLIDEHAYTQDVVAKRVGKNRATVANTLRLLQLPKAVQQRVVDGTLSEGHARAILGARDAQAMSQLAEESVSHRWSVRQTEAAVRRSAKAKPAVRGARPAAGGKSANVTDLERRLSAALGMRATIHEGSQRGRGRVEIAYDNLDQLDRFIDRVLG